MAYSKDLVEVGIVAGGPWNCTGSKPPELPIFTATTMCMNPCPLGVCSPILYLKVTYLVQLAKLEAKYNNINYI